MVKFAEAPLRNNWRVLASRPTLEAWVEGRLVVLCPNTSGQHVTGLVGDLMVTEVLNQKDLFGLHSCIRVAGDVGNIAFVFATIPEHLRKLQHELLVNRIGVGRVEQRGELVPVD